MLITFAGRMVRKWPGTVRWAHLWLSPVKPCVWPSIDLLQLSHNYGSVRDKSLRGALNFNWRDSGLMPSGNGYLTCIYFCKVLVLSYATHVEICPQHCHVNTLKSQFNKIIIQLFKSVCYLLIHEFNSEWFVFIFFFIVNAIDLHWCR